MKDAPDYNLERFNRVELLFPSRYLKAADLMGRDVTVTIARIEPRHTLESKRGKEKKPVVHMQGKDKMWILNVTNAKTIAKIYGNEVKSWLGKRVTIYPTTMAVGGETHECIRVRPTKPEYQPPEK